MAVTLCASVDQGRGSGMAIGRLVRQFEFDRGIILISTKGDEHSGYVGVEAAAK